MKKFLKVVFCLTIVLVLAANSNASPYDLGTVGASGTGQLSRSSNGLVMGIVFDTTVPSPPRGGKALNQVRALKNLVQNNLKLGDYFFIESVSRGYNGFYVADSGGGQHRWSGGLMVTLTKIGTAEEEAAALGSSDPYTKVSVRTKDSILQYIEDMVSDESSIIFNDAKNGRANMQGAIYMARLLFKQTDSMVVGSSKGYKKALFVFSDGHFTGSTNPMMPSSSVVPPTGDWVDPDAGDPVYASAQLVMNDFGDGAGSVNKCTDSQANNSTRVQPHDDDFQCFDYWNKWHRTHPTPLPNTLDLNNTHMGARVVGNATYTKALHYDSRCLAEPSANALAAEQADLARSDNIIVYGFMPKANPDPSDLGAMQRLTVDQTLPDCWIYDADSTGPDICPHYTGIVHWRFAENASNDCGGYESGDYFRDLGYDEHIPPAENRQKRLYLNEDFGTVDLDAGDATNRERGFSLTLD